MLRAELHRAVARATGDTLRTIQHYGFQLLSDSPPHESETSLGLSCPGCGHYIRVSMSLDRVAECPRCDAFLPFEESELIVGVETLAPCA